MKDIVKEEKDIWSVQVVHKDGIAESGARVYQDGVLMNTDGKWEQIVVTGIKKPIT